MLKNETSFAPDVTATAREGGPRSQISMRELSGRNLMDDTLNKSSFIQAQQTNRSQPKAQLPLHNVQISPPPIKRRNIIIPAIIIVVLFTLIIANQIKNDVVGNIDQAQSTNNLFLLNRQGTLSTIQESILVEALQHLLTVSASKIWAIQSIPPTLKHISARAMKYKTQ